MNGKTMGCGANSMYDKIAVGSVNSNARRGKDKSLAVIVGIAAVFLSAMILLIAWFATFFPAYEKYVTKLSDSTCYAYESGELTVQAGEEIIRAEGRKSYDIYNYLTINGQGYHKSEIPEADCDLFLDYGDGGTLSVWEISEENDYGYDAQKWVSFILYENEDYSYGYLSGNKKMVDMYIRLKY